MAEEKETQPATAEEIENLRNQYSEFEKAGHTSEVEGQKSYRINCPRCNRSGNAYSRPGNENFYTFSCVSCGFFHQFQR